MKKQGKKSIIAILGLSSALFACSSGSSNSSAPVTPTTQEVTGPVNYMMFVSELLKPTEQAKTSSKSLNGAVWTEAGNIASLNPYAALAFSSASLLGGLLGFGQPTVSTNQIYSEELTISNQITDLQKQLSADQNVIFAVYQSAISNQESEAYYSFNEALLKISNPYETFVNDTLGAVAATGPYSLPQVPAGNIADFYSNNSSYTQDGLTGLLGGISNSACASSAPATNWESAVQHYLLTGEVKTGGPMATATSGGTLVTLLNALKSQLLLNLTAPGVTGGSDMVPLISQYNQTLEYVYLNTVMALQQAYILEASQNYFQTESFGTNGGKLAFQDCANANYEANESATLSYPDAQSYLTQLFADRMNIAYQTVLSYMVSDYPMIALNSTQIPYQSELSATTQAKTLSTNIGGIISGGWQNQGLLYQESTILGYKSCAKALRNGESFTAENCPSLTPNMYSGYYDGESISAYIVNPAKNGYNLFSFSFSPQCSSLAESGITTWSSGLYNYGFMCNQWAIVNDYSINYNSDNLSLNFQLSGGTIPTPGWIPTNNLSVKLVGDGNGAFVVAEYNQDYHVYINTDSAVTKGFSLVNGNGNYYQQGNDLYDGGFGGGGDYHTAGMQVILPNGFIFPFYIFGSSAVGNEAFLSLVCPSASYQAYPSNPIMFSPNVVSCTYSGTIGDDAAGGKNNPGNSIITIKTLDGNSYNIELNGEGGKGLMQQAYLAVYQN